MTDPSPRRIPRRGKPLLPVVLLGIVVLVAAAIVALLVLRNEPVRSELPPASGP